VTQISETSVYFQRTTQFYIPEDRTLYNHRSENFKSYYYDFVGAKYDSEVTDVSNELEELYSPISSTSEPRVAD
jgi:hypothetical protein